MIVAPIDPIEADVPQLASDGSGFARSFNEFELRTDAKIVRYPNRYATSAD